MKTRVYHQDANKDFSVTLCRVLSDLKSGCASVRVCVTAVTARRFDPAWDSLDFQPFFQQALNVAAEPDEILEAAWEGKTFSCEESRWSGKRFARFLRITRQVKDQQA
ncbi:MAG: hypothetical protein WC675_05235 [Patescibacteria group bacterium]|jgi:hypothetical protein